MVAPEAVDLPPEPVEMVMPVYPEKALKERVRGVVVLKVVVSETGQPERITVLKSARADLTQAAIEAARQWRFEPARKNGEAVRTTTTIRFPFEGVQFARTPFPALSPQVTRPAPTRTPTRVDAAKPTSTQRDGRAAKPTPSRKDRRAAKPTRTPTRHRRGPKPTRTPAGR
jgi:TonB family protein